ncbi:MAG: hypothetical protein JNM68_16900, partial [Dinghuibacter sp.]|nr:hypothetical protein [Dinghuibacter sp.]
DLVWVNGQPNLLSTTTPEITPFNSIKNNLPDRFVMDFAIHPRNDDSVYVALGGFGTAHIYVTGNGGATWTNIGAGLPDIPFTSVLIDPLNPSVIYAGCDLGVYVSADGGATWLDFNNGFWDATPVADLQVTADNRLVAATHGKGVFTSNLYSGASLKTVATFAGYHENGLNRLHCVVQNEQDVVWYELERSTNGKDFSRIATFRSNNRTIGNTYEFHDAVQPTTRTTYYYRTRLAGANGTSVYTRIVALEADPQPQISILNNPFGNQLNIEVRSPVHTRLQTRIVRTDGAVVLQRDYAITTGVNRLNIFGLHFLLPGIYLFQAEMPGKKFAQQIVK